jgi:hypothetical protein
VGSRRASKTRKELRCKVSHAESEYVRVGRRKRDWSSVRRLIADDDDLIARSRHLNLQAATYVGWKLLLLSNVLRLPNYLI